MTGDERIRTELARLLHQRRATLLVDVGLLETFRRSGGSVDAARGAAHRLAGTLGLFGLSELGQMASELDERIGEKSDSIQLLLEHFVDRATAELVSD